MNKLIIIRGIPGSGKTTMAKNMKPDYHFEADMYFTDKDGIYNYDASKIKEAQDWCYNGVKEALNIISDKPKTVIVSNTFVKLWEMKRYIELAKQLDVPFEIIIANGNYKNVHGVPDNIIQRMISNWEDFTYEEN